MDRERYERIRTAYIRDVVGCLSETELLSTRVLFERVRKGARCEEFHARSFDEPLPFDFEELIETLRDVGAVYRYEVGGNWRYGFCVHFVPVLVEIFNIDICK